MLLYNSMSDKKERYDKANEDAAQTLMRKNQVITVRYKVYLFFLGIFLFVFWPVLTTAVEETRWVWAFSFSLTSPLDIFTERGEWGLLFELDEIDISVKEVEEEIESVKVEKKVVTLLSEQEKQNTLINCLNNQICEVIDERLMNNIKFLRIFMMMNYLWWEKMSFDQKIILRSINEFLNKEPWWRSNWTLQWISFWEPKLINEEYKIKALDVTMNMEFDHKRNLISFLENTEDKVFVTLPVLYVIDTINYDIVNYTESQAVNIWMKIYYFDGKPPQEELEVWTWWTVDEPN